MNDIDLFHGTAATLLPAPRGIARYWDWRKAQSGNCHPGACSPSGMVSVCPSSGMYPSGYGRFGHCQDLQPHCYFEQTMAYGVTHFQQSGTGNVENFYNYLLVSPFESGVMDRLEAEEAHPGYYSCRYATHKIGVRLTACRNQVMHAYAGAKSLRIDPYYAGLDIPLKNMKPACEEAVLHQDGAQGAKGHFRFHGITFFFSLRTNGTVQVLDRELRVTCCQTGETYLSIGFSFADCVAAGQELPPPSESGFQKLLGESESAWSELLSRIEVRGGTDRERSLFRSCFYHSLLKPCRVEGRSPFPGDDGQSFFDIATFWDHSKCQFPFLCMLRPTLMGELCRFIVSRGLRCGKVPTAVLLENYAPEDPRNLRFENQGRCLPIRVLYDAVSWGVVAVDGALLRACEKIIVQSANYDDFMAGRYDSINGVVILDFACAAYYLAELAKLRGDSERETRWRKISDKWSDAFDPQTHLLINDRPYYEGTVWNYSFFPAFYTEERIRRFGGNEVFSSLIDTFFGYGEGVFSQEDPGVGESFERRVVNHRFEGLNNETDFDTPFTYSLAGRHHRTCEVLDSIMRYSYGLGEGGLPGNDDSGALSSFFVWNSLGIFPGSGLGRIYIGTPIFDESVIMLGQGSKLTIQVKRSVPRKREEIYVKRATLNGRSLTKPWFQVSALRKDVVLTLEMTSHIEESCFG